VWGGQLTERPSPAGLAAQPTSNIFAFFITPLQAWFGPVGDILPLILRHYLSAENDTRFVEE